MKTKIFFFFFVSSLLFAQDYFPLAVGNIWEYQWMNSKGTKGGFVDRVFVKDYNKYTEEYLVVTITKWETGSSWQETIYEKREGAILLTAERESNYGEWNDVNRIVLKLPLKIGVKWSHNGSTKKTYEIIKKINLKIDNRLYEDVFVVKETIHETKPFIYLKYYAPNIGLVKSTNEDGTLTDFQLISAEIK